jgi:hypothetical protein
MEIRGWPMVAALCSSPFRRRPRSTWHGAKIDVPQIFKRDGMMQGTLQIACMKCLQPIGIIQFSTVVPGQFIFYCTGCWDAIQQTTPEEAMNAILDEMNRRKTLTSTHNESSWST